MEIKNSCELIKLNEYLMLKEIEIYAVHGRNVIRLLLTCNTYLTEDTKLGIFIFKKTLKIRKKQFLLLNLYFDSNFRPFISNGVIFLEFNSGKLKLILG